MGASRRGMVVAQRVDHAVVVVANGSHSYALPRHSGPKIYDMHFNPCRATIRPLCGSHDEVNWAPCKLFGIGSTECHRLHRRAVERQRQACVAAIPHEANCSEGDVAEEEGWFRVPHPSRREVVS